MWGHTIIQQEIDMTPTTSKTSRTALVIGATGGVGSEVAKALIAHGWHVRALTRNPARVGVFLESQVTRLSD